MPKGARHILTGILRRTAQGYALEMEDGGVWRLDPIRRMRKLLNTRVTVEGVRAGFDLIDVEKIASAPPGNAGS